jgi:hypothetical protein
MVHGCTLFLPLQTRTPGLWTNNEQPKRRNEMSDKMMTPDEYLIENPTALIFRHEISKAGQSTAMTRPGNGEGWKYSEADILIDWTGYTEPHVMIGPDFPQSRKLEVKWGKWRITPDKVNKGDVPFQSVELPDGGTCFRIGKYIDEPSQELNSEPYRNPIAGKEPELSRFLPDGWAWRFLDAGWFAGRISGGLYCYRSNGSSNADIWHEEDLLHPSEGGGFQKHNPGDPMPCDGKLRVDLILNSPSKNNRVYNYYSAEDQNWEDPHAPCIIGWRPHYEEQN